MINTILNDRYHILEHIGGGGMADVYKAKDQRLERDVAIKILKDQFVDDEDFVKGFTRESHAAARLNHPNIVGVYDVGFDDSNGKKKYYIVMELIKGYTLKDKIRENSGLGIEEAIDYTLIISKALQNAHKNGIIHRDVKPQNILLQDNKDPKVTDFGIAQGATKATVTGGEDILGSVHYFSPEQASGKTTDERSDIYSLGIVLYEMLTGKLPFNGDTPIAIALKHIQEDMPAPSLYNDKVSPSLDQVVLKMTQKDPDDRYNNLEEVIGDLEKIKQGSDPAFDDTILIPAGQIVKDQEEEKKRRIKRQNAQKHQEEIDKPKAKKKSGGLLSIVMGILLALGVVILAFYMIFLRPRNNEEQIVEVPDLVGVNIEDARASLEELGLELEIIGTDINPDYNIDDILEQDPRPGSELQEGDTIEVVINTEMEDIKVGNYVSMSYSEVSTMVINAGLILGDPTYEEVEDQGQVGRVLSQDLRPGTIVAPQSIISFTVGIEKEVETTTMPNLIGQSLDNAISLLEASGLEYTVSETESDRFRENTVMSQSFEAGSQVEVGSTVELAVVVAPEEEEEEEEEPEEDDTNTNQEDNKQSQTVNLQIPIPDIGEEELHLRIDRIDSTGTSQVYSGFHAPGEGTVTQTVEQTPGSSFQIYIDNELVGTYP